VKSPAFAAGLLVLLVACERRVPVQGSRSGEATDGGAPDSGSADAAAAATVARLPALDGQAVRKAYEAILAGRLDEARSSFAGFGRSGTVSADQVREAFTSPPGAQRGLLRNARNCVFGDVGHERCRQLLMQNREGGVCDGERYTVRCGQIAVDTDGHLLGAYWNGESVIRGRYLVTYSPTGLATIKNIDDFNDLLSIQGEVVSEVEAGRKLVVIAVTPLDRPSTRNGETFTHRVDAHLVDPLAHKVSGPCRLSDSATASFAWDSPPEVRVLADGARWIVREGDSTGRVTLCSLEPSRVLAAYSTWGDKTWLTDRKERVLFVSGIPVRSTPTKMKDVLEPDVVEFFDHVSVDLASGRAQRIRTREETAGVPGRDMVLAANGGTLAVGSYARIELFSTEPFRCVDSLKLEIDFGSFDSSYDMSPQFTLMGDGATVAATLVNPGYIRPQSVYAPDRRLWLVSLNTRKLILRGRMLTELYEDRATGRSAFAARLSSPKEEQSIVVVDEHGNVTTREMTAGEGDAPGEKLPTEFASMKRRLEPTWQDASEVDSTAAGRLAEKFCAVGGLFVPKAACR
jgi:hypothetical protein